MKKRMITGLITASMIFALGGCGSVSDRETTAITAAESATETVLESASETQSETAAQTTSETETMRETEAHNSVKRIEAYKNALEDIYQNLTLPDGTELKTGDGYDKSENTFAIYDVDHDGKDELVFEYTATYMAAMTAKVYDYDEENDCLKEELSEFPALHFYDNATITADISHNQGYAGDFWPYTFYRYDADDDVYQKVCYVDAWNKEVSEAMGSDKEFPEAADKDGDGIVYYVDRQSPDDDIEEGHPIDKDAYDTWYEENIGCANEEELPFQNLTEENINSIQ